MLNLKADNSIGIFDSGVGGLTIAKAVIDNLPNESMIYFGALATPLLVPIIEEGFFEHVLIDIALNEYLSNPILQDIDALVLGCTHYPVIKNNINNFYRG